MPVTRLPARFHMIETYMIACMADAAHDCEHIYRVLYSALDIARHEPDADENVLTAACLLHDIGRAAQNADPSVDHADAGARQAYDWLTGNGNPAAFAVAVRDCIATHRFRSGNPPVSIEAKILFDADKLDACGAIGIARTLLYRGNVDEPLFFVNNGGVSDGTDDAPSFMREYKFKLERLYNRFYTVHGTSLAKMRQAAAVAFYNALLAEARSCYGNADILLK